VKYKREGERRERKRRERRECKNFIERKGGRDGEG